MYTGRFLKTSNSILLLLPFYGAGINLTIATLDPQPIDPNAKPQGKPHVH